ncbi:MAG: hypothetical protein E7350_00325 [Clostridiales bacterium]|nr:hypothetical protein [Clostridiales bacterium]
MSIVKSFNNLPRLVQILLLLIPGVNWITELAVRISAAFHGKALAQIIMLIICIPFGAIMGWLDLFSVIFRGKFILT